MTDECGNSISKDATFTIIDTTNPTWTNEPMDMVSVECDPSTNAQAFSDWLASFSGTDSCGTAAVTHNSSGLSDDCGGTGSETVTFTLTDECGNSISKDATFTIIDTTNPTWTNEPMDMVSVECDPSTNAQAFSDWLASFSGTDSCGTAAVTHNSSGLSDDCGGTGSETVTFTLTDECGNSITKDATFTIIDTTPPSLIGGADGSAECRGSDPSLNANYIAWRDNYAGIVGSDTCGNVTMSYTEGSWSSDGCTDTIIVTFKATDACGLESVQDQSFTISDTTPPSLVGGVNGSAESTGVDPSLNANYIAWRDNFAGITSNDLCGTPVLSYEEGSWLSTACGDEISVTFISTDECGLTSNQVHTFVISDSTPPSLLGGMDDTAECTGSDPSLNPSYITWRDGFAGITANDISGSTTLSYSEGSWVTTGCSQRIEVVFTAEDECGLTTSQTQAFVITDTTNPTWTNEPMDMTSVECDPSTNAQAFSDWLASFSGTDSCGTATVTHNSTGLSDDCGGTGSETVTFTLTDECGNSITKDATFTIIDTTNPTWTNEPMDMTSVECDPATNAQAFSDWLASFSGTDSCGTAAVTHNSTGLSDDCGGTGSETVTFTLTDECGNSITKDATFTIIDTTNPTWTNEPMDMTSVECDPATNAQAFSDWLASFSGTDSCGTAAVTHNSTGLSDDCGGTGSETVTFTLTDECGNSISKDATFTIIDSTAPVIDEVNKDNIDIECGVGDTGATLQDWLDNNAGATATDNCSDVTWTNDYGNDTSIKCDGSYITVTFTATDACGNSSTTTAGYLIKDETPPTITHQPSDKIVECDGEGNLTELNDWLTSNGGATATDDCSVVSWSNNYTDLTYTCSFTGEVKVIFTAKDACGNPMNTNSAKFIIKDTTAPEFVDELPAAEITVSCDNIPVMETLTATDNCDASVTVVPSEVTSGDDDACGSEYLITRKWTVSDCSGNTTSHIQVITVEDTTAPEFVEELPAAEITVSCDNIPVMETLTATDNCDASVTVVPSEVTSGDDDACGSEYLITRKWTVSDCSGNTTSHIQVITVEDTTAPEFVEELPAAEITVSCDNIPVMETLTATDNCDASVTVVPSEVTSGDDDACGSEYLITRKWTVSDCSGNTTSHIQVITVEDTTAPEFVEELPAAEITVSCDNIPVMETLTATDNCDASVTVVPSEVTSGDDDACGSEYLITRKWTVSDCSGNTTSHIQVITVEDTTAPEFVEELPAAEITVSCDEIPAAVVLTGTDNCDASVTVNYSEEFVGQDDECASTYTITRKWMITDCAGNETSHTQVVTVEDTTAPEFEGELPAAEITVSCDEIPAAVVLTGTDNCDASVTVNYSEEFVGQDDECGSTYTITRKWMITDCAGNETSHTQVVTVEDTTAPEFVEELPAGEITVSCDEIPAAVVLTGTDNCDASVTVNYSEEFVGQDDECGSTYTITRKWMIADCTGNETSHTQVVTVEDTTAPEFEGELPAAEITVSCDEIPAAVVLTGTDNCDASVTVNYSEEFAGQDDECGSTYTITRKWMITDCAGNETSHTQVVTVEDTTAPEFEGELPVAEITVSCDEIPAAVVLTGTDNCDASVTVNYSEEFAGQDDDCGSTYTITRRWMITDCAGNETSHTQVVNVEDTKAPELVSTLEDISVECDDVPEVPTLEFTDNCSSNVTQTNFEETSTFDGTDSDYIITRTWTVADECGNTAEFVQNITVTVKTTVTEIADSRCTEDGVIDLNDYLANQSEDGTWEVTSGNVTLSDDDSFEPLNLSLGDYVFTYTAPNSGCLTSTRVTININDDCVVLPCGQEDVVISKAVTPNGDSYNEFFKITGVESCGFIANVKIFNRWGAKVFESNNYANDWNGVSDGSTFGGAERLPAGTYYYIVILENSGLKPFTGAIYLGTK
ncbi:gliding motility-associated C-terminal domain-containing protein [Tenacibaculum crassostreae]|uniref:gliding motility-associated C-terminal domain-containing protein n=1 Tax=Tenacibaculum crassostreae TaxID=502683 RepID=UPI0038940E26